MPGCGLRRACASVTFNLPGRMKGAVLKSINACATRQPIGWPSNRAGSARRFPHKDPGHARRVRYHKREIAGVVDRLDRLDRAIDPDEFVDFEQVFAVHVQNAVAVEKISRAQHLVVRRAIFVSGTFRLDRCVFGGRASGRCSLDRLRACSLSCLRSAIQWIGRCHHVDFRAPSAVTSPRAENDHWPTGG